MTKPERNWIDIQNAPVVHCSECGAQTWLPLGGVPRGWVIDGGLYYCNLHAPEEAP